MACRLLAITALAMTLAACAGDPVRVVETVDVPIVVERPVLPLHALIEPIERPADVFVGPGDPAVRVCLNAGGATFVKNLVSRDVALRDWVEEVAAN